MAQNIWVALFNKFGGGTAPGNLDAAGNLLVSLGSESGGAAVTIASGGVAAGAFVAGAAVDGWDATEGDKADAAWTTGSGSVIALLKAIAGASIQFLFGSGGALITSNGGKSAALDVTAAAVIKAAAGRLCKIIVISPGTTSGALTLNDSATTGGAATANQIFSIPYNGAALVAGAIFTLDVEVANGIVVSAVPSAGSPQFVITYN